MQTWCVGLQSNEGFRNTSSDIFTPQSSLVQASPTTANVLPRRDCGACRGLSQFERVALILNATSLCTSFASGVLPRPRRSPCYGGIKLATVHLRGYLAA